MNKIKHDGEILREIWKRIMKTILIWSIISTRTYSLALFGMLRYMAICQMMRYAVTYNANNIYLVIHELLFIY